jgi:hypothetical protein
MRASVRVEAQAPIASPIGRLQRTLGNRALRRIMRSGGDVPDVPADVDAYLARNPAGQPLGASARAYFEPRFGRDLSAVHLHTDAEAADSASALDARAYTVGRHVFFGASQYAPDTTDGRKLLAHELTHVVQQGARSSPPSAARVSRYASVTCTTGTHSAPSNAEALIASAEMFGALAIVAADADLSLLKLDAILPGLGAGGGYTMPAGQRLTDYQNSWGLPTRVAGTNRHRDRLGGGTYPSQAEALVHEIEALKNRYSRLSTRLLGNIRYRCIGGRTTIGGCTGHCTGRDATSCFNMDLIMVCPGFWSATMNARSLLLVHEAAHRVFNIDHARNFRHANCYANYAAAAAGQAWAGGPACVP